MKNKKKKMIKVKQNEYEEKGWEQRMPKYENKHIPEWREEEKKISNSDPLERFVGKYQRPFSTCRI